MADRNHGDLTFLQKNHNVISFDQRGSGLSPIGKSKHLDSFLRAKYIIGDIEQIRREELGNGENSKWDAIYAHSYGTVIAQMYAATHPERVNKLIFSAPIARHIDTEAARTDQVIRNIEATLKLVRFQEPNAPCNAIGEIGDAVANGRPFTIHKPKLKEITIETTSGEPTILCGEDFST